MIAARTIEERAQYARVIASFAAGPNVALAAPMACPVLGDKSIVERLRNLKMAQESSPRRRLAARALLFGGALALPMTASISYAEANLADAAEDPVETPAPPAPLAPVAPAPPAWSLEIAPQSPQAPQPPAPPDAPNEHQVQNTTVDPDEANAGRAEPGKTDSKDRQKKTAWLAPHEIDFEGMPLMSEAERAEMTMRVRESMAESEAVFAELRRDIKEIKAETALAEMERSPRTIVKMSCDDASNEVSSSKVLADGTTIVTICQKRIMEHALNGLVEARASIAHNSKIEGKMRSDILLQLDRQIREWRSRSR